MIRQSIENDARTFLFHFKFDHIFFNKFFLQFHQVVYLQVFEGLPLLLALLYVPHLEIVISKIVTIIERMNFRLNVETVGSFLLANEVQVTSFGISVHSQTWFGGNLEKESNVIVADDVFCEDCGKGDWDVILKEEILKVWKSVLHWKNGKNMEYSWMEGAINVK